MMTKINMQLLPMKGHYFLWNAGTGVVMAYLSSYLKQLGFSSVVVGFIYMILPISGMLAKPIFGLIGDRFHCQKILFLASQLLTAAAFLAIFYSPQVEVHRTVRFNCDNNNVMFTTTSSNSLDNCTVDGMREDDTIDKCILNCDVNDDSLRRLLCEDWNLTEYCDSSIFIDRFTFHAEVPKSDIHLLDSNLNFNITKIETTDGRVIEQICPSNTKINNALCQIQCDDYSINDILGVPSVSDDDVYNLFVFWNILILLIVAWVGQAIGVSIGDAICFQMLADKPHRYGMQRMWGSLGWGVMSAFVGYLMDVLSKGRAQKDYTCAFYFSLAFLIVDFVVSLRLKFSQKKLSSTLFKDVGKLLCDVRIWIFLIWCVSVGMCTGLIWNFLFWHVEELAQAQGCESYQNVKTLEGIIQAIQCVCGEIPFFFFSGWIIKKLGHINTMSLVLFSIGLRFCLYSVITNPWWFLPVETMNGLTFGLFFACMASYASLIAPAGTAATMQGLVGAVFEGVGVSLGSLVAGYIYEEISGPLTFRYFGFGAFAVGICHVIVHYLLRFRGSASYFPPKDYQRSEEVAYLNS